MESSQVADEVGQSCDDELLENGSADDAISSAPEKDKTGSEHKIGTCDVFAEGGNAKLQPKNTSELSALNVDKVDGTKESAPEKSDAAFNKMDESRMKVLSEPSKIAEDEGPESLNSTSASPQSLTSCTASESVKGSDISVPGEHNHIPNKGIEANCSNSQSPEEEHPPSQDTSLEDECANKSSGINSQQSSHIPTPVFEDITDDEEDSDGEGAGDNIELELDDLIDPGDLAKETKSIDTFGEELHGEDGTQHSKDKVHDFSETNTMKSNRSSSDNQRNLLGEDQAFTIIKKVDGTTDPTKHVRKQKVTARKSGRPMHMGESAPLKTINLHPIKDITMNLSDVEGMEEALYLPVTKANEAYGQDSKETSSTENSISVSDTKLAQLGRKKRRKKSYDLPGCKKKLKKIRSDAESIGSSADSLSLADSVSLSDGDFQEFDLHREGLPSAKDSNGTTEAKIESSTSSAQSGAKVQSVLDILTKNSHLGFAKSLKLGASSATTASSSKTSPSFQSSKKSLFPPSKPSSGKSHGKIGSVLDMLHRRSRQKAESSSSDTDNKTNSNTNSGTHDSPPGTEGSSINKQNISSITTMPIAGTTTTTICVTSSESSTTTTIMVSPNKPIVEGMKRKGTPRKRKEEVICLSDSEDSDEKSRLSSEGKRKKDMSQDNGNSVRLGSMLTTPTKGQSLLKPRFLTSPTGQAPNKSTPTPLVMVVAQHSTAAGMRSLLPQHTLFPASGGVMQSGKMVRPQVGNSQLLPLISTLPVGAKTVNLPGLPAGMTAVPITSLPSIPSVPGQQTVALFGPIPAPNAVSGAAVPLSAGNIVNISGSKHLLYAPAPIQAQSGAKIVTNNILSTSSVSSAQTILLAAPQNSTTPTKSSSSIGKSPVSLLQTSNNQSGQNLESLRALLVGKPVALSPSGRSTTVSSSAGNSLLTSPPMLFQMVTTSGTSLVPISAQPLALTSTTPPHLKHVQQHSLLKNSSSSVVTACNMGNKPSLTNGNSLVKSHALNGISCLTPPKTPDTDASSEVAAAAALSKSATSQAETSEVIPLCSCKISGTSFNKLTTGATYCQALDTVDNKILGCFNKINNSVLVRPGVKIPFMAVCEVHRKRLKLHQCCPGCGHFCTQGSFQQCSKEDKKSVHTFHKQCMFFRGGKNLCPHCGEECTQGQVELRLEKGSNGSVVDIGGYTHITNKREATIRKTARMSGRGSKKNKISPVKEEDITLPNNKVLDVGAVSLGPDQQILAKLCKCAIEDRPKKYRSITKDLFSPASEGDVEKVFYLLMDGLDPNTRLEEQDGQTAMHAAANCGSMGTVVLLQQFGAEIHAQDKSLRTPMMCAAESGNLEVVKFLNKAGAKVEDRGEDGMTCLHYAAKSGHIDIIKYILSTERLDINIEDDGGWTPIIWATESQLLDVVRFLVKHGGDPNKKDNEENTGLHWAAFSGSLDISELFLDMGCELDSPNEHGDRPLHIAARQDHYDIVVLLLARGANVDLKNNKDETPVECCLNKTGQVCMALKVNQQLRSFAARKLIHPERLVERDITMGREKNPIACVNAEDDEPCPTDYLYVTQNVETSPLNINFVITSIQSCRCKDDCSSMYCVCGRSSIKCWYDKMGRLLEEVNLLEPPLVFECNRACRCLINCNNRVVQNGITCRLQMFRTNGRGWGVRTLMDIPKGTFVCEYIGELISDSEADIREDDSYLFDLDNKDGDTYCIDARKYGNISRFINHLCEPNLVPVKVYVEHQDLRFPRICLFSSRDVSAYEELGFDYGEKFWMIKWKFFTCACKSSKCKYSSDTIKKTLEDYKLRYPDEQLD